MIRIRMGATLEVVGANGAVWRVQVVNYIPSEEEMTCVIPKGDGQAYISRVSIHDLSRLRVKTPDGDLTIPMDDYWIAVGTTYFEKSKIREVGGEFQITQRKRRKRQPPAHAA